MAQEVHHVIADVILKPAAVPELDQHLLAGELPAAHSRYS